MPICARPREKYARLQQSPTWLFHQFRLGMGRVQSPRLCTTARAPRKALLSGLLVPKRDDPVRLLGDGALATPSDSLIERPEYSRPLRNDRQMYGIDSSVVNARTDVQMIVNLICHCGSTVYELRAESA
jgi:hypothetical protein